MKKMRNAKRSKNSKNSRKPPIILSILLATGILISGYGLEFDSLDFEIPGSAPSQTAGYVASQDADGQRQERILLSEIPEFSGSPYIEINDNEPFFEESDLTCESFESYSELDSLGRCGLAMASVGVDLMPTEERGSIGMIKPTGWHTIKYDCVSGKYLYNRCHLIGYLLTGENANERNLITGTRYMNVEGMLPFETMVASYVEETENHVLYRVTPIFDEQNLLANGVEIEAYSVEDDGDGICFNVFVYNVQPQIEIDYATGESKSMEISVD